LYLPVYKIVDPIDKVFPSFALVLILFLILFLIIFGMILSSILFAKPTYEAEISVLSAAGAPIAGVTLEVLTGCESEDGVDSFTGQTDSTGLLTLQVCNTTIDVTASKEKYKTFAGTINLDEEKKGQVKLSLAAIPQKQMYSRVTDKQGVIITHANLAVKCADDGNLFELTDQNSSGFNFLTISNCSSIQLTGSASGYKETTVNISINDERSVVALEKLVLKGKVSFETTCPSKEEPGVTILVTNNDTKIKKTVYTDNQGAARSEEFDVGSYSFSASSILGDLNNGTFTLDVDEKKTIPLSFPKCSTDANGNRLVPDNNVRYLWIKTVDRNFGVMGADVVFYLDSNVIGNKSTSTSGETTKQAFNITSQPAGSTLRAVIQKIGYQTKVVTAELRAESAGPQVVSISQGGGKINAKVIDDTNAAVKDASVLLYMTGVPFEIDQGVTDKNGMYSFAGLPNSTYKIRAVSASDEGTLEGIMLNLNETKDVNVRVIKSNGTISFELLDKEGDKVAVTVDLMEKVSGVFKKNESYYAKSGSYSTPSLKVETQVKLAINDLNFIPMESPIYSIAKTTAKKTLYLRKKSELPNDKPVQVFLDNVYKSDPRYGTVQGATSIMAGTEYYFYFTVVITGEVLEDLTANFFVAPEDRNTLISDNPFVINDAFSVDGANRVMSSNMISSFIDPADQTYRVESGAKQANVLLHSQKGPRAFPVIVRVMVDENVTGQKTKIFFEAMHGAGKSLKYSKEFTIGKSFCIKDCPAFLFSNYVKWGSKAYDAIEEDEEYVMLIGDSYTLKTVVENTTDEQIGDANLKLYVTSQYLDNLKLAGDKNEVLYPITLTPLSSSLEKETSVTPIKSSSSAKIYENVAKISGNLDVLEDYEGNEWYVDFEIDTKEELEIIITPEDLDAKSEYPVFLMKTRYKDGRKVVPAHWRAEVLNADGTIGALIKEGNTDKNGLEWTQLDLKNLVGGTKVQFYAWDDNGAVPATFVVELDSWPSIPQDPAPFECLTAYIGATKVADINYPQLPLVINASTTISIKSDCNESRLFYIESDGAEVVPKQDTIAAGATQTITITAKPRYDSTNTIYLLGAYPLQIMSVGASTYSQIGKIDIVISDSSSCFSLNNAIFDLRTASSQSSYVDNKCFSGRKDNFYP
ncbi:MAG: carboxypeptidase-like regulatory domain-containing protein, partial [archaeon]